MTIDPTKVVIKHIDNDAGITALVEDRVAPKHRYGGDGDDDWALKPFPVKAITIRADGGTPDVYTPVQVMRFEARCYGANPPEAMAVYQALVALTRSTERNAVVTEDGSGLLYLFLMSSGPSMLYDTEIDVNYVLTFIDAAVHEQAVS